MKKMHLAVVLFILLLLTLAPHTAQALSIIYTDYSFSGEIGQTYLPDYPDFTDKIDRGLSQSDFNIRYTFDYAVDTPKGFEADGRITIKDYNDAPDWTYFYVIYEPKVYGRGWKAAFQCKLHYYKPLTEIDLDEELITMSTEETARTTFEQAEGTMPSFQLKGYDASIINVSLERVFYSETWALNIYPKAKGETDITIEHFNGTTATIHVIVGDPPSKLEFLQDEIIAVAGQPVYPEMDLGGGVMRTQPTARYTINEDTSNQSVMYVHEDRIYFSNYQAGVYDYTVTTFNGHTDTIRVYLYSKENCKQIKLKDDVAYVGEEDKLMLLDQNGYSLFLPMEITKGADIATLRYDKLKVSAPGTVEITVHNPDGTTIVRAFEYIEKPTKISLNAEMLTMKIGDTFDLEVSFDKGSADYHFELYFYDSTSPDNLKPVRLYNQQIIADAPGKARVTVSAGFLAASCQIEVLPGDREIHIVKPNAPLNTGDTWQLSVEDKTGKKYPAYFRSDNPHGSRVISVTQDGLMTAHKRGSAEIIAVLDDGRELSYKQEVINNPAWISHADLYYNQDAQFKGLGEISSDIGPLHISEVDISIADEKIATYSGTYFTFHKEGSTKVTLTSKANPNAQTTFTLTVIKKDYRTYHDSLEYRVPEGYTVQLPQATEFGKIVDVDWMFVYQSPGEGNPNKTGFKLSGDTLECTWGDAFCQISGTTPSGKRYRVDAYGYRMAEEIAFSQSEYFFDPYSRQTLEVIPAQPGTELGPIMWFVETEDILTLTPDDEKMGLIEVLGNQEGSVLVGALMVNGAYAECRVTIMKEDFPGDADNSNHLSAWDVLVLLQKEAGWDSGFNARNADVNNDDTVDLDDAMLILRKLSGEPVVLK